MRERLIELIGEFVDIDRPPFGKVWVEYLTDHLLANGVIVPPCKVGDTVYRVCKKKYDVDGYGMQWEEDWGIVTNSFHLGMFHEIGKTVFLTKEEAEQVLVEREKHERKFD